MAICISGVVNFGQEESAILFFTGMNAAKQSGCGVFFSFSQSVNMHLRGGVVLKAVFFFIIRLFPPSH